MGLLDAFDTFQGRQAMNTSAPIGQPFSPTGFAQQSNDDSDSVDRWKQILAARQLQAMQLEAARRDADQGSGSSPSRAPAALALLGNAEPDAQAGANAAPSRLAAKWQALQADHAQARAIMPCLEQIQSLATKAAAGSHAAKLQYANGLLAAVGAKYRAADLGKAGALLNLYEPHIVARLGAGGYGEDAVGTLLQAADPNAQTTPDDTQLAADRLMGANSMLQAKLAMLAPHAQAGDANTFHAKEAAFHQAADPMLFQLAARYQALDNPAQRKSFVTQVLRHDPQFVNKLSALEDMGVEF